MKDHVSSDNLLGLVTEINNRIYDGEYEFEHFQLTSSRFHKYFEPYTLKTLQLVQKILSDFILTNQSSER